MSAAAAPSLHLPVDLYSSDQLGAVILELHDYIDALRDENARAKAGGKKSDEPLHISALLLGVFHGSGLKIGTIEAAEKLQKGLQAIHGKAPVAHLSLAALPARTLKRQLTVWFRSQVHPYMLLTFAMRADICGGIVVQTGSHVWDLSFREPLINNRTRIAELMANVR